MWYVRMVEGWWSHSWRVGWWQLGELNEDAGVGSELPQELWTKVREPACLIDAGEPDVFAH